MFVFNSYFMFLVVSLFVVSTGALAEQTEKEDKEDLGAITIEDESESIELLHSPMPVSIIDAERFHGRNISLNEVLKRVAGVKIAQEGGLGSRSTIAINGLEGRRVKVFIDGNPLNAPDGSLGINDIPIQLVERIEVYKGVVPAKFGGDALGGAVNVVVRDFEENLVDLNLSLGSYDTQRGSVILKKRFDKQKIELGIGGFYNHAANDYIMNSPYLDGLKIKRDHDEYTSVLGGISVSVDDRWFDSIDMELINFSSEKEIQGIQYNIREAKNKSEANIFVIAFEKKQFFSDQLEFKYIFVRPEMTNYYIDKATTCYNFYGSTRSCPGLRGEITGVPHDSADNQNEMRHDLNLHYSINRNHAFNFHLNSQTSRYKPNDPLASDALGYDIGSFPSERINAVSSLSYESSFINDKIVNDMGVKQYDYDYTVTPDEGSLGTPEQTHTKSSETGFYESIRYSPLKGLFFKASYEHAYRLPDSEEIFGNGSTIISAPELKPEEADNFNLGVLFDRFDFAGMPWVKAEATYFSRDLINMIKLVSQNRKSQYSNLSEVSVRGFEFEVKADLSDAWYMYVNYTHQELKDRQRFVTGTINTPNPTYGLDIPNVPKQFANFGIEHKTLAVFRGDDMLKFFWESAWVDEYYHGYELSQFQDKKIKAQTSHATGLEYSFNDDQIIIGFEIHNLTDEEITDVFKYPLMGRSYHLNLRYNWFG